MHYIMYIKRESVRESERATARARAEVGAREPERQGGRADLRGIGSKRDLLQRQKRPTIEAKETYYRGKRDLL